MAKPIPRLSASDIAQIIESAWHDHPPFANMLMRHGVTEGQLVQLLKRELTPSAYKLWAKRLTPVGRPGQRAAAAQQSAKDKDRAKVRAKTAATGSPKTSTKTSPKPAR
ncbi:hypothetical protein BH11PSE8_BH11PSE8_43630 [soil metagenome]